MPSLLRRLLELILLVIGLAQHGCGGQNLSVNYDAFYSIKTIINKLSLTTPLGNSHGPFVYYDYGAKRKIIVWNDYIEDAKVDNYKLTMNSNYLYSRILVNVTNTRQCTSSCIASLNFTDMGNSPLVLCSYL